MKKVLFILFFLLDGVLFVHLLSPDQTVQAESQPTERGVSIEAEFTQDIPPPILKDAYAPENPELPSRVIHIPPASPSTSPEWHRFTATAYCLHGITRTGTHTRAGTMAVDPSIIPFGSILELSAGPYSGVYYALDSGGSVKGKKVDLYIPTRQEALRFGRQSVFVRFIRTGWGDDTPVKVEKNLLEDRVADLQP